MIDACIDFIRKDLETRGEKPTSKVTFFGALFSLKVKKEGDKRAKTATYSAAKNVLPGYREIIL